MIPHIDDLYNLDLWKTYMDERWCVVGTGPSLDSWRSDECVARRYLAVHKATRVVPHHAAIFTDWERFEDACVSINPLGFLFMPWMPHFSRRPTNVTLEDLLGRSSDLASFFESGRLYSFDMSSVKRFPSLCDKIGWPSLEMVEVNHSGGEAAIAVLGRLGVKYISTVGIDGGTHHSKAIGDVDNPYSYDAQDENIAALAERYKMTIERLPCSKS